MAQNTSWLGAIDRGMWCESDFGMYASNGSRSGVTRAKDRFATQADAEACKLMQPMACEGTQSGQN